VSDLERVHSLGPRPTQVPEVSSDSPCDLIHRGNSESWKLELFLIGGTDSSIWIRYECAGWNSSYSLWREFIPFRRCLATFGFNLSMITVTPHWHPPPSDMCHQAYHCQVSVISIICLINRTTSKRVDQAGRCMNVILDCCICTFDSSRKLVRRNTERHFVWVSILRYYSQLWYYTAHISPHRQDWRIQFRSPDIQKLYKSKSFL